MTTVRRGEQKMRRNTRQYRGEAVLNKLAEHFGTDTPRLQFGSTGRRNVAGLYYKATSARRLYTNLQRNRYVDMPGGAARIVVEPRGDQYEILVHEYAHHLDHCRGLGSIEPPSTLPEVREFLGCPKGHYLSGPIPYI